MLHESGPGDAPPWTDEDDDELAYHIALSQSYHLFFVVPKDEAFPFETQFEGDREPEFEELLERPASGGDDTDMIAAQGRGYRGWSVAVSLVVPFAAITLSEYTVFDDGFICNPLSTATPRINMASRSMH